jgi:hypothetical protein
VFRRLPVAGRVACHVAAAKGERAGGCQPVRSDIRRAFAAAAIDRMAYWYREIVFGKQGGTG